MPKVSKRTWTTADGTVRQGYVAAYSDQNGRRIRKQFASRRAADEHLVAARAQVATGTFTSGKSSFADACAGWLARGNAERLEPATLIQYKLHVRHLQVLIPPETKLARIAQPRCEQLRDDLLRHHSRIMATKILGSFRMIMKEARRRGMTAQNVAGDTTIGTASRHSRKLEAGRDFPLPAAVQEMLAKGDAKARALVTLAAGAGLRASEIRGLRWSAVNLGTKPSVTVRERADRWGQIGNPKSREGQRTVPLTMAGAQILREWRLAQPSGRTLVFGTRTDRPEQLSALYSRILHPLYDQIGCLHYGLHSLRHYAISSWLCARLDLKQIQTWSGHSTAAMVLDTYGHLIPRPDEHEQMEAVARLMEN